LVCLEPLLIELTKMAKNMALEKPVAGRSPSGPCQPTGNFSNRLNSIKGERKMEKTKHTPGPWGIMSHHRDAHGKFDYIRIGHDSRGQYGPDFIQVDALHWTAEGQEQANANARLIAAAPDLLEALKGLLNAIAGGISTEALNMSKKGNMGRAYDAIAKAEGRE